MIAHGKLFQKVILRAEWEIMSVWEYLALLSGYFIHSSVCDEACAYIYRNNLFKPVQVILQALDQQSR